MTITGDGVLIAVTIFVMVWWLEDRLAGRLDKAIQLLIDIRNAR